MSAKVAHRTAAPGTPPKSAPTEPARPTGWVHGEHPERTKPRFGEEPPALAAEPSSVPEGLDR